MNISVLLPSRGRLRLLMRSTDSLLAKAHDPDQLEILVGLDPDDVTAGELPTPPPQVTLVRFGERYGYARLHEYVNRLAEQASGHWLMLWNDDAIMPTPNWDQVIMAQRDGVLFPHNNHTCGGGWCCNVFPIWPRAWTGLLGHVSLNAHCDSWIQEIGDRLGCTIRLPELEVYHDRHDLTGNNNDITRRESQAAYQKPDYYTPEMARARLDDALKLQQEMAAEGQRG